MPLPGERIALHIFEPRYQQLFNELEANDLEEFGILFSAGNATATSGAWGGVMRLVFATEADDAGRRNAIVQCVGLLKCVDITLDPKGDQSQYPIGVIQRFQEWKDWRVDSTAMKEVEQIDQIQGTVPLSPAPPLLTDVLLRYGMNALERFEILLDARDGTSGPVLLQKLKFKRMILEQEALKNRGYFPN
jgi:hypothetical protein